MGGLTPGIGGLEWVVIGLVALVVVGPERLPGLLRELGKWVAKARGMANEFRASFDEMARQSELDELRKEVEALRTGQSPYSPVRLGAEADAAFKDIKSEFDKPALDGPLIPQTVAEPVMTPTASEWPDGEPVMLPVADPPLVDVVPTEPVAPARKARAKAASPKTKAAPKAKAPTTRAKAPAAKAASKPRTPRSRKTAP